MWLFNVNDRKMEWSGLIEAKVLYKVIKKKMLMAPVAHLVSALAQSVPLSLSQIRLL